MKCDNLEDKIKDNEESLIKIELKIEDIIANTQNQKNDEEEELKF
jgi:hypothetical protein